MLTDTHCHLDFEAFNEDRSQVLDRCANNGIERILVPGINLDSSRRTIELAETEDTIYSAVGFHPNEALMWERNSLVELRDLVSHPKVVAIGEIGLDYLRGRSPHELQKKILREQLELAEEFGLPVVIHNRQASTDVLAILIEWQAGLESSDSNLAAHPGVLHSFSDDIESALKAIKSRFYIGFTGPVTFRNADTLQNVAASIPLENILIETDAPFLTPHPHRGKRNEPSYVHLIAEKIAALQDIPFTSVAQTTTENAKQLFQW